MELPMVGQEAWACSLLINIHANKARSSMIEPVVILLLVLLSGMLGLEVAFVAIPALGLFGYELKHVIMHGALLLG